MLVRHIPGRLNVIADSLSRRQPLTTEWTLHPEVFSRILERYSTMQIDLFVTRFTRQMPQFVSPLPDDQALSVDGLMLHWAHKDLYAFPPTILVPLLIKVGEGALPLDASGTVAVETELDHRSTSTNTGGPTSVTPTPGPSAATSQPVIAPQPRGSQATCLEAVRQSLEARGFSRPAIDRILIDKRASTIEAYNAKWTLFCQWCEANLLDPLALTTPLLADFFAYLLSKGLAALHHKRICGSHH